ncbi:MAG: dephospho-CoA kinase [Oscillospiraceae bacterium]|nr:dephospho-CoA kinase [Oscillospiraceae bacterium]
MKRFYVAALTGRSGSGKSYAGDYLKAKGVAVLDGDKVAREVVKPGERALDELVRSFGEGILFEDGSLNRRALADLCFSDPKLQSKLNSITHPAIIERLTERFEELKEAGEAYCLVEAAALIESGFYAICDKAVMIRAPHSAAVERIMNRDGLSREQAEARLAAQTTEVEVEPLCDMIIDNDSSLEDFNIKLDGLKAKLDEWFGE